MIKLKLRQPVGISNSPFENIFIDSNREFDPWIQNLQPFELIFLLTRQAFSNIQTMFKFDRQVRNKLETWQLRLSKLVLCNKFEIFLFSFSVFDSGRK